MMSLVTSLLWRYSRSHGLVHPDMADDELRTLTKKFEPGLIGYLIAIGIGLIAPRLAVGLYLLTSIFLMLPLGALRHRPRKRRPARAPGPG
jgi:hypothetical protein